MNEKDLIIKIIKKEIKRGKRVGVTSDNKPITAKKRLIKIVDQYYNDYPHEDIEIDSSVTSLR